MAIILSIETALSGYSVALFEDNISLAYVESHVERNTSQWLTLSIDHLLNVSSKSRADINAVAISSGPGSYTGLRIGLSVAKGICFALDIPLISIDTLEVMAQAAINKTNQKDILFCPMIDARRMEVYTAIYDFNLKLLQPQQALVIDEESFKDHLSDQKIAFFGNGALKYVDVVKDDNIFFIKDIYPSAKEVAQLATIAYHNNKFEDLAYFEPNYLKEFYTPVKKQKS